MTVLVTENSKGVPLACVKPNVELLEHRWLSSAAEQAAVASHVYNN
jgi:hypothetical protein